LAEKKDIVKNALQEGISLPLIMKLTGLDEPTVKDIQAKIGNEL